MCREALFNCALLGSPGIARRLQERIAATARDAPADRPLLHRALAGRELLATSFGMGMCVGFITNGPDQLKTRIQNGQFKTFPEAIAWQLREGGGVRALYGRAAIFRGFYTGHGVLALNFMRHKVEHAIDSFTT